MAVPQGGVLRTPAPQFFRIGHWDCRMGGVGAPDSNPKKGTGTAELDGVPKIIGCCAPEPDPRTQHKMRKHEKKKKQKKKLTRKSKNKNKRQEKL